MKKAIDGKHLEGLTFRSSRKVKSEDGHRHQPTERALEAGDVIDWADRGDHVVIVSADGRKHEVFKDGKKAAAKEEAKAAKDKGSKESAKAGK